MRYSIEGGLVKFESLEESEAIEVVHSLIEDKIFYTVYNVYGQDVTKEFNKSDSVHGKGE